MENAIRIIADSGSTKTDWTIISARSEERLATCGLNPYMLSSGQMSHIIHEGLVSKSRIIREAEALGPVTVDMHFYGAGCTPEKTADMSDGILEAFEQTDTERITAEICSDLMGAARALLGRKSGIACILGTGSNSCLYDGERITDNVSPLGYILGDEGGGVSLGRRLVSDCLKRQMPDSITSAFYEEYRLTGADIIQKVYREHLANRFLASFAPFLAKHRSEPAIRALILDEFSRFLERNIFPYGRKDLEAGFVGSVAFHFEEELREAAKKAGIAIGQILQSPMEGLIAYHAL